MKELARRLNFFTASFLGIVGISLIGEVFQEDDFPDKIDDFLIFILGLAAIYWYKKTGHKLEKASSSLVFLVIAFLIKLGGIIIEHADKEALGDDIGVFIPIVIALIFVAWQVFTHKKNNGKS